MADAMRRTLVKIVGSIWFPNSIIKPRSPKSSLLDVWGSDVIRFGFRLIKVCVITRAQPLAANGQFIQKRKLIYFIEKFQITMTKIQNSKPVWNIGH
jgi:hypothetical protein